MNIIFFGNADFSVTSLDALKVNGHNLFVVTSPSVGRQNPVQHYCLSHGIPHFVQDNLKNEDFLRALYSITGPKLVVAVAFKKLPREITRISTAVGVHASMLPEYKGAAPIQWAIMNGETKTGVSIFKLFEEIDGGDILLRSEVAIEETDTGGTLHEKLKFEGARLLIRAVSMIEDAMACRNRACHYQGGFYCDPQSTFPKPQHKAPKLFRDNTQIDWSWGSKRIYDFVRALYPWPVAWANVLGQELKIHAVRIVAKDWKIVPVAHGVSWSLDDTIQICTGDGVIELLEVQPPSKRKMTGADYLRGHKDLLTGKTKEPTPSFPAGQTDVYIPSLARDARFPDDWIAPGEFKYCAKCGWSLIVKDETTCVKCNGKRGSVDIIHFNLCRERMELASKRRTAHEKPIFWMNKST